MWWIFVFCMCVFNYGALESVCFCFGGCLKLGHFLVRMARELADVLLGASERDTERERERGVYTCMVLLQ